MKRKNKNRVDQELLKSLVMERLRLGNELSLLHQYEADLDESIAVTLDDAGLSHSRQTRVLGDAVAAAWAELLCGESILEGLIRPSIEVKFEPTGPCCHENALELSPG